MKNDVVGWIYGEGKSFDEDNSSKVLKANITIENGIVKNAIYGEV